MTAKRFVPASCLAALALLAPFALWAQPRPPSATDPNLPPPGVVDPGCTPFAVGPMDDVASVYAEARVRRVEQAEQFTDCCLFCEEQSLEALRPTPTGPERTEKDGGLPFRTSYCGTVTGYGVNDERDDPRDILINISPAPGFEHFSTGFGRAPCDTPIEVEGAPGCLLAEVSPADQFYGQDRMFLPIHNRGECTGEDNDPFACESALEPAIDWPGNPPPGGLPEQAGRQVCVYGVYAFDHGNEHRAGEHADFTQVLDSGHDIPEIHPFDAVWFVHPGDRPGWIFGAFQDDSNRYSVPTCGGEGDNSWSQGPRDLTFHFPFRFPRADAPVRACLRHTRTVDFDGGNHSVEPLNVTTSQMPDPLTEVRTLTANGQLLLEVVEPTGAGDETQIQVYGCATDREVTGFIKLRVAVGCAPNTFCFDLDDREDPGSGFYYAELVFGGDCGG